MTLSPNELLDRPRGGANDWLSPMVEDTEVARLITMYGSGRRVEAEAGCSALVRTGVSDDPEVQRLARAAAEAGCHASAVELMAALVAAAPLNVNYRCNLAVALGSTGRHAAAADAARAAIKLRDNWGPAWDVLGVALERLGRHADAAAAYRRSLSIGESDEVRVHLANALRARGDLAEAELEYGRVLGRDPASCSALRGLSELYARRGCTAAAQDARGRLVRHHQATPTDGSNYLVGLYSAGTVSAAEILVESRRWHDRFAGDCGPSTGTAISASRGRPLRIGYVSPDFREHPVGRLVEPILAERDRSVVENFCYSDLTRPADALTARLKGLADHWRDTCRFDDASLLDQVRRDHIDVLVDPTGHFAHHRLLVFARRAAPVQLSALGWCGTTGVATMDFRVTDPTSDPLGQTDAFHTERLTRLPAVAWAYRPWDDTPAVRTLPADRNGFVTFANLNNPGKTTAVMAGHWAKVLRRVKGAKLMLLVREEGEPYAVEPFLRCGVAEDKLICVNTRSRIRYMDLYNEVDIALDPFPFNGDNTTCDALWMGVPIVTLAGHMYHQRRGLSHLNALGLRELVATTPEEYVDIAVSLAGYIGHLRTLRGGLRERVCRSPLGDTAGFVKSLERAYTAMLENRMARLQA